jgi:anti-sigma regulatory factor (Ser/Thr protein kinase)
VRARDSQALRITLPARRSALPRLRAAVDAWLGSLGLSGPEQSEFMLVVTEAADNAIEHAYPADQLGATFDVEARLLQDGTAAIRVTDRGTWRDPADARLAPGRGLMIMRELTTDLNVVRLPTGTTIELWQRLVRPVVQGTTGQLRGSPSAERSPLRITRVQEHPDGAVVLRCSGVVDATTVTEFSDALQDSRAAGTWPVVVDLTAVALLNSAGVRALAEQMTPLVTLVAAPGSHARSVLDLMHLPVSDRI